MVYNEIIENVKAELEKEYAGQSYKFEVRGDKFEQLSIGSGALAPVEVWRDSQCWRYIRLHVVLCARLRGYEALEFMTDFVLKSGLNIESRSEIGIYASPVGENKQYMVIEITIKQQGV